MVTSPCVAGGGCPLPGVSSIALSFLLQFHPRGLEFALLGHGFLFKTSTFCSLCSLLVQGGGHPYLMVPHWQRISSLALGFSEEPPLKCPLGWPCALELPSPFYR